MDEEIVLDRGHTNVMKLDADEQALMDEIEISVPRRSQYPDPLRGPCKGLVLLTIKKLWMPL